MSTIHPIAVIGAGGRSGQALSRTLLQQEVPVIGIFRRKVQTDLPFLDHRQADLTDPSRLAKALEGASIVINTAHACHTPAVLNATDAPVIALGSARKFTQWPDEHGQGVLAGEAALKADNRPSLMLHPTMIYGAQGEDNIQRLAQLLRRLPIVPLPARGRFLIQPIEQDDVTQCLCAALALIQKGSITEPESIVIGGADVVSYRAFISLVLHHAGLRPRMFLNLPAQVLMLAARLTPWLPGIPVIQPEEVRRLLEDKNVDIEMMRTRLGIEPQTLERGLAKLFQTDRSKPKS